MTEAEMDAVDAIYAITEPLNDRGPRPFSTRMALDAAVRAVHALAEQVKDDLQAPWGYHKRPSLTAAERFADDVYERRQEAAKDNAADHLLREHYEKADADFDGAA